MIIFTWNKQNGKNTLKIGDKIIATIVADNGEYCVVFNSNFSTYTYYVIHMIEEKLKELNKVIW